MDTLDWSQRDRIPMLLSDCIIFLRPIINYFLKNSFIVASGNQIYREIPYYATPILGKFIVP